MTVSPSLTPHDQQADGSSVSASLERIERALHQALLTDGRRIWSIVALGLIKKHPSRDGAGDEARVQRAMIALFGEDSVIGRPRKQHEDALLRMADMHVCDHADRDLWEDRRKGGLVKGKRGPRIRGSERLAEAAALEVYGRSDDTIIRRLKDDFNKSRAQLLDLRQQLLETGDAEKEIAALILDLLDDTGLDVDLSVADGAALLDIEELVY